MVSSVLAEGKGGFIRAKLVCKTLENFFASADEELTIDHVPIWCKNSQGQRVMVEQSEKLVSPQCIQNEGPVVILVFHFLRTTSRSHRWARQVSFMTTGDHVASAPEGALAAISLNSHNSPAGFLTLSPASAASLVLRYRQVYTVSCTLVFPLPGEKADRTRP